MSKTVTLWGRDQQGKHPGRTTRMLERVALASQVIDSVLVVCHDARHSDRLRVQFIKLLECRGVSYDQARDISNRYVTFDHILTTYPSRVSRQRPLAVFIDNWVSNHYLDDQVLRKFEIDFDDVVMDKFTDKGGE